MYHRLCMDGAWSDDFGMYINGVDTFGAGAREVSTLQIPGRNGDLIVKADRLQNYDLTYSCFIVRNFDANIAALRAFLLSRTSYFILNDTYHPDEYRRAFYRGPFTPAVTQRLNAAKFDLVFNVKPQRFLNSGNTRVTISDGYQLRNPTDFPARPLVRLEGNGTFQINGGSVLTVAGNTGTIYLDCDTMNAYSGYTNKNRLVSSSDNDWPVLNSATNTIHITGFTAAYITPRWWTI